MSDSEHRTLYGTISALLLGAVPILCSSTEGAETPMDCKILHETADGIYVDLGTDSGLEEGAAGWLRRTGATPLRVEVVKVASSSTFLRILSEHAPGLFAGGDDVTVVFDRQHEPENPSVTRARSPTLKDQGTDVGALPLLATPDMEEVAASEARNIFHGRITARQLYQIGDDGDDNDYSITRLRSSGSLERIIGTPWTLEWNGLVHYRAGDELEDIRNFEDLHLEAYRLSLYRRFDDRSFVRLGRFLPGELPTVGFLDGVQGEKVLSETLRVGGMIGLKPDRITTSPSLDEPTVVSYVTYEPRTGTDLSYSGTAGLLFSLYEGDADRLALLWDQQAQVGRLQFFSSSVVDVDVGGAEVRDGVRLTWWTLNVSYPVVPLLQLRAGIDKYELPDTEAERDTIRNGDLILDEFFREDTWRYWVGASHELPWNLRLSEKVSYTESKRLDGWRASVEITRRGLPYLPDATLTLSAYTIRAIGIEDALDDGLGGRLAAYIPFMRHRLSVEPAVTVRYSDYATRGENFFDAVDDELWWIDVSLRTRWVINQWWSISGGVSYSTNEVNRLLVDLSVTFRW